QPDFRASLAFHLLQGQQPRQDDHRLVAVGALVDLAPGEQDAVLADEVLVTGVLVAPHEALDRPAEVLDLAAQEARVAAARVLRRHDAYLRQHTTDDDLLP